MFVALGVFLVVISRVARPRAHSHLFRTETTSETTPKRPSLQLSCTQSHQGTLPLSSNDTTYIAHNINTSLRNKDQTSVTASQSSHGILGTGS